MVVAVVNFAIRPVSSVQEFLDHCDALLDQSKGADWVVFPECHSLELASLFPQLEGRELIQALAELSPSLELWATEAARNRHQTIVAGTTFVQTESGPVHVASTHSPDGKIVRQPKNQMTQFESEDWGLSIQTGLKPQPNPKVGVLICYDSEFPEAGRAHAEAGVELLVVPAFTETQRGFQRVRWSCLARAVENQIFVAHASLVGGLNREPVPSAYGSSAIIAPSVTPFPESAILAETPLNVESVAIAELDFELLDQARNQDDVRNWHDRNRVNWSVTQD